MMAFAEAHPVAQALARATHALARQRAGVLLACLSLFALGALAQHEVRFPSLERGPGGAAVELPGYWFPAGAQRAGAVVLLHGCGGPYDRQGRLSPRMREYAAWLNAQGFHALVVDSLTPRGERELCTQRIGTRRLTQANRRLDALAAVAWLARRSDVVAGRIGLLGWSNGGSTVLAATNAKHALVREAAVKPAFAVAFYPGCEAELAYGYEPASSLLLLVGEADDWTPAEPCKRLAERAPAGRVTLEAYADAFHAFDSTAPVRVRGDVPNGVNPGQGVHVGGNAAALKRSREALAQFLASR